MGLDMYWKARHYMWSHNSDDENPTVDSILQHNIREALGLPEWAEPKEIYMDVGYLRKANQIHNWIVQNLTDGRDDCQDIYFNDDAQDKLREICEKIKDNHDLAPELLPTASGFSFGSTEYGDYYFEDIDYMLKILDDIKELGDNYEIFYRASW